MNDDYPDASVPGTRSTRRFARIPVRCPQCGAPTVMKCHWIVVTTALNRWNKMKLQAACCGVSWDASAAELDEIRRFLDCDTGSAAT
jgi:hypothetical protein